MKPHEVKSFAALVWLLAAASACQGSTHLERLAHISGPVGGNRPLAALDVSGDGRIGAEDRRAIDELVRVARLEVATRNVTASVEGGYYQGPPRDAPSVFSLVDVRHGRLDLRRVPRERVAELLIEARWLDLQLRLADAADVAVGGVVSGMLQRSVPGHDADEMRPAELCEAVARLDLSPYARAGLPATAVLDVDSTVWAGNGTDVLLGAIVALELPRPAANGPLKQFLATLKNVDAAALEQASVIDNARLFYKRVVDPSVPADERVNAKDAFYNLVALLEGVTVEEARRAARIAVQDGALDSPAWKTRLYAAKDGCGTQRILGLLAERGVDIYFLSATPDVMVEEAGRLFGLRPGRALGSVLEVRDGRFTGQVRDNTYEVKGPITRQLLPAPPLLAFGDSPTSDFAMLLEATGAGFMVNPRQAFATRDRDEAGGRLTSLHFDGTVGELATRAH